MEHVVTFEEFGNQLPAIPPKDQNFAQSLYNQWQRKGSLSPKQMYWVGVLCDRANENQEDVSGEEIGDLQGIKTLFERAKRHLSRPAIVLSGEVDNEMHMVRVKPATMRARYPESINVIDESSRVWLGRIHTNGEFEQSRGVDNVSQGVIELLRRFAAEPEHTAQESGKLTGKCCFCNRTLTDERSTEVGYGPICADHYGLQWG